MKVAATYHIKLEGKRQQFPEGYLHETFIHLDRPHNFLDNHSGGAPQQILLSPEKWLTQGDRSSQSRDTNAIHWLNQYTRNPYPRKVIWDLTTRASRSGTHGQQYYWLDIGSHTSDSLGLKQIEATFDPEKNTIVVNQAKKYLKILVNERMLDFQRSVEVVVGNFHWQGSLHPSEEMMKETLAQRGDYEYIFSAEIILNEVAGGQWDITVED